MAQLHHHISETQVIILAGGLGTRLRSAVPDLPKCMAPVNGKPFIAYIIDNFLQKGIQQFILSLGYKHESITDFIQQAYPQINIQFVIEKEPLGTGGAIRLACEAATSKQVIATNGDTMFKVNVNALLQQHISENADCSLSLKPLKNFNRFGVVELDNEHRITSFKEKQQYAEGLINGGVYAIDVQSFLQTQLPEKFSFEKDYLEAFYSAKKMIGFIDDAYFIDIGIPEDFQQAQIDFASN